MRPWERLFPANRWLEPLLCAVIAAVIVRNLLFLYWWGYLPQPFFYQPEDTFMDWFNPAYWAHNAGAYDSWGTIYPPLSFVVLQVLTDPTCYSSEGYAARDCDWYGLITLHLIYLMNFVLVFKAFRIIDRGTATWRTFALCAGTPMLFALERGNLLLLCFTALLLAYGPLVKSARLRWLAAACAINFKVYLIGTLFAQLLRGKWRWFEGAAITTVLVYVVTFAIYGAGFPTEIYSNIRDFSGLWEAATPLDLWFAVTFKPILSLLANNAFPSQALIGSYWADMLMTWLPIVVHATQALIVCAAIAAWLRPAAVPQHRVIFFAVAMALITSEAGGYTQVFLFLFVFMERWKGIGRKVALILTYLLSIPGDIIISGLPEQVNYGFMGHGQVLTRFGVGLMPFLRPALIIAIVVALALVTLRDAFADARAAGWGRGGKTTPSPDSGNAGALPA